MTLWLLKLRKMPLVGWLVAIIAVLIALLVWVMKSASYRERQLRVSMQISSAKKDHAKRIDEVEAGNALKREQIKAIQEVEIEKLEEKRKEIRKAEKVSSQELSDMVNAMFKR